MLSVGKEKYINQSPKITWIEMNTPTKALVRKPSDTYKQCVSSHPLHHTVDVQKAREQHQEYCRILSELGLEVIELPIRNDFPDSCFVEDNAVVYRNKALITRMGEASRRGEEGDVEEKLKQYLSVKRAVEPATIEGGDVIHLPNRLICGITQRSNKYGAEQMMEWLSVRVDTIENPNIIHLKSYMKYLGKGTIITTEEYKEHPLLKDLNLLIIPKEESYSVNCLAVGDSVVMSDRFSNAHEIVYSAGFEVIVLNVSEFEKCQASLTCLSILF
jgi:dimethylargininase